MLSNSSISLQRALASRAMRCTSAISSGDCSRSKKSMNSHRGGGRLYKRNSAWYAPGCNLRGNSAWNYRLLSKEACYCCPPQHNNLNTILPKDDGIHERQEQKRVFASSVYPPSN